MNISSIFSFLIYPGKNLENLPEVKGVELTLIGNLFNLLAEIFERADQECNIPIRFLMAEDGSQNNETRDLIISYIESPDITRGIAIANRLCRFTTNNPGLGLLFLMIGNEGIEKKLVISRFPAEKGILAEEQGHDLLIEFIEKVFMKSTLKYKAALFRDSNLRTGFWSGHAIDKQLNMSNREIANYWIHDFLFSDFKTTSIAGTRRFAIAIREASKQVNVPLVKEEIVSLAILVQGMNGQATSIQQIMDIYHISPQSKLAITSQLNHEGLLDDHFIFDIEEYKRSAAFASIELSNEGILLAPVDRFNDCFSSEIIDDEKQIFRFSTVGQIVERRIRGRK